MIGCSLWCHFEDNFKNLLSFDYKILLMAKRRSITKDCWEDVTNRILQMSCLRFSKNISGLSLLALKSLTENFRNLIRILCKRLSNCNLECCERIDAKYVSRYLQILSQLFSIPVGEFVRFWFTMNNNPLHSKSCLSSELRNPYTWFNSGNVGVFK